MLSKKDTHADEVRPFVLFMLIGGLIVGTVTVSLQRYTLGSIIAVSGCSGAMLLALMAHLLDRLRVRNR
jgi:hypothetical protein